MNRRNDDTEDIERREWNVLLYGEAALTNRFTTQASMRAIAREDLVAFHRRYFHPAGMIAAVSGAFSRAEMIRKLEAAFAGWPGAKPAVPPVPSEIATAAPGSTASRRTSRRAGCRSACPRSAATAPTSTPSR